MTLFFFTCMWMGCTEKANPNDDSVEPVIQDTSISEPDVEEAPVLNGSSLGESELYPAEEELYRNKKRMRIEHVQDSMVLVSGGVEWRVSNEDKWEQYSATLGVPDFQFSSNLKISILISSL